MQCVKTGINVGTESHGEVHRGDLFVQAGVYVANVNPHSTEYSLEKADIIITNGEARSEFGERNIFVFDRTEVYAVTDLGRKVLQEALG